MGAAHPRFYYYPDSAGTLEEIDLGEGLSDIQRVPTPVVKDAVNGYGTRYRNFLSGGERVRIILERFGSPGASAVERDLYAMENHLQRGGSVGFSAVHSKAWCGFMSGGYGDRGRTILYTGGNLFTAWSSTAALVSGDEVVIQSPNPEWRSEVSVFSFLAAKQMNLSRALRFTYAQKSAVRYRDFFPVLKLPDDQVGRPLVTHDKRITYTFDALLEYDFNALAAAVAAQQTASAPGLGTITVGPAGGLISLDTFLGNATDTSAGSTKFTRPGGQ